MEKKKVVIIGAGPAGLTAGYTLLERSTEYDVVILEESDVIGGISQTVQVGKNRMDIGGHRFFSKDEEVTKFWEKIMPLQGAPSKDALILHTESVLTPSGPDPEKVDRVMLVRNRVSRIYSFKRFFDYPISMKVKTVQNLGFGRAMKSGFSYLHSVAFKKEEDSLENFYINRFGKTLYGYFFENYTEKLWGRHPSEISADWGAQRVKGLSITAVLADMFKKTFHIQSGDVETSLIEQFQYPKFGPGQLWETVASDYEKMGGTLVKNTEVKHIHLKDGKVTGLTCLQDGKEVKVEGDIFISSMPLKDLVKGMDRTQVPEKVRITGAGLPYRDFITVGILVDRLKLKNTTDIKTLGNIVPDCWIYVQEPDVKMGRIQIFNNWSPYMVEDPEHTVWMGLEYFCDEGDEYWTMPDEEFINFAIDELIQMDIIDAKDVKETYRKNVKKAYPAYFDSYKDIDVVTDYIDTIENLYCVGRNGQHRYNNMDHSMATSFITVDCILNPEKNKSAVWDVNTDKEYHEEK